MIRTFAELLDPMRPEEFFESVWSKNFCHIKGAPGKFAGLLPWSKLNEILCTAPLNHPRMRVVKEGTVMPIDTWIQHTQSKFEPRTYFTRVQTAAVTEYLRQGATLTLDSVDELAGSVTELAVELQRTFCDRVQINAYAGFRTSQGFDLHWDDHDVFILQVSGRKRWGTAGVTRPFPIRNDIVANLKAPEKLIWEEILEEGDVLYLPRGWWHVAFPLDEPTLHLTCGVYHSTGLDLLQWLAEQMRASEAFRRPLPRFGDAAALKQHVARLREELLAAWSPDLPDRFLTERDSRATPPNAMNLPWAVMADLPPSDDIGIKLATVRPLKLKADAEKGTTEFTLNGKKWKFPTSVIGIFRRLEESRGCTIAQLCEAFSEQFSRESLRDFLRRLLANGLITLADIPKPEDTPGARSSLGRPDK